MADVVFASYRIEREIFQYKGVVQGSYKNDHGTLTRLPKERETKLYDGRSAAEEAARRLIHYLWPSVEDIRDHSSLDEQREDGR